MGNKTGNTLKISISKVTVRGDTRWVLNVRDAGKRKRRFFKTYVEAMRVRNTALQRYLAGINQYLDEPIEECLALDAHGNPCIEAMSAVDLEKKIHLPKGNIFHGDLTWPFAEDEKEIGQWGVETEYSNLFLCGSSAKRGGAVSGIP